MSRTNTAAAASRFTRTLRIQIWCVYVYYFFPPTMRAQYLYVCISGREMGGGSSGDRTMRVFGAHAIRTAATTRWHTRFHGATAPTVARRAFPTRALTRARARTHTWTLCRTGSGDVSAFVTAAAAATVKNRNTNSLLAAASVHRTAAAIGLHFFRPAGAQRRLGGIYCDVYKTGEIK